MLGEIQKPHLLAMFIILVYMRGQGAALKDVGQSNWGIRRSIGGQPELVLLDAGSWTAVDPWAFKKPRRGERLPRPPEQAPGS